MVSCRKCRQCQWIRQRRWQRRAQREFEQSTRTWWITLTHRPGDTPPTYKDVQRWLKAVRKRDPALRYLITEESGSEKGRLHWHVLLHCSSALQRRPMQSIWKFGHFHARLAKTAGLASYMAKYQAKAGRLRASTGYGKRPHYSQIPAPSTILDREKADDVLRTYNDYSAGVVQMRKMWVQFQQECSELQKKVAHDDHARSLLHAHKDAPLRGHRNLFLLRKELELLKGVSLRPRCEPPGHDLPRLELSFAGSGSVQ